MKIPEDKRPVCSCGEKMVLVEYNGYYESFRYWDCYNKNCDINSEIEKYKPDDEYRGCYA